MVTGESWFDCIRLDWTEKRRDPTEFVRRVGDRGSTRVVVTERPEGRSEDKFVGEVFGALRE
jgi:hypothetical protein